MMDRHHRFVHLLLFLTLLSPVLLPASAVATQDTGGEVLVERRVYSRAPTRAGEMELVMDLYRPREGSVKGAVVLLHGGGFTDGSIDVGENKVYGRALARRGYLGAAVGYRLHADAPVVRGWAEAYARMVGDLDDPRIDGAIERFGADLPDAVGAAAVDAIAAVDWLRRHAGELGFDPEDIALFGASAGAITALTTAYALDFYGEGVVDVAGVIDLRGSLLSADTAGNPFDADGPPLLMLHGASDRSVPLPDAEKVFQLAAEAGTPVELYVSDPHGHELGGRGLLELMVEGERTVLDHIDLFLEGIFAGEERPARPIRGRLLPAESPGESGGDGRDHDSGRAGFPAELRAAVESLIESVRSESEFVASLYGLSRRELLEHPFLDPARRDWSYWPRERAGLPIRYMTAAQRTATQRILATLLSSEGYLQVNHIMLLEELLVDMETVGFARGAEEYTVAVFGEPSPEEPWGFRFEGHHVSLNVTLSPDDISVTPSFLGASPVPVPAGIRAGFHPLRYEQRYALDLLESLDANQLAAAVLADEPPAEILTTQFQVDPGEWDRWQERLSRDGVSASTFDGEQRRLLHRLLTEIVDLYRDEVSRSWLDTLDLSTLAFAWMGHRELGRPHYFRIQGQRFVLELDAAQGDGTHVHTVWRDREDDFGRAALRAHYGGNAHEHP